MVFLYVHGQFLELAFRVESGPRAIYIKIDLMLIRSVFWLFKSFSTFLSFIFPIKVYPFSCLIFFLLIILYISCYASVSFTFC